ncbi:MAG TPA: efflux RND transporter periplasmic adaptor subunit [Usitatibacteraceae bacterium]|nr:efflux RND transporter periplasmic adaptor subunit [Usitatibacteraceae bacterium]
MRPLVAAGLAVAIAAASAGGWWLSRPEKAPQAAVKGGGSAVPVTAAQVERRDVPVRLRANGTAVALQSVDVRAQITSTVREVHIREGQSVARGDLMFSLDSRAEEANLKKAEAQVEKDRADLANAQRTLERQRQLFEQKFISQSALDAAQNQVETLKGQLAVDLAAVEGTKVALGNTRIHAAFAGRTGAIGVRPGSLVQPNGAVLVTVTQTDPIQVGFTLPEKEFTGLQRALAAGPVMVEVSPDGGREVLRGRVNFLDNAVDTVTGTIRVKAEFDNRASRLWPGMFVNVLVSPRTLGQASVVPVQAVQTGPEYRFVFVIGDDRKVALRKVGVEYIDEGIAVVTGIEPGTKVVVEGAQNLRPGSLVSLGERTPGTAGDRAGGGKAPGAKSGAAS